MPFVNVWLLQPLRQNDLGQLSYFLPQFHCSLLKEKRCYHGLYFFLFRKVKNMEKHLTTSSFSMFKCFNIYKNPIISLYLLWFYLRKGFLLLVSFWQGKDHLSRKIEANGMFSEQKYLPNCLSFRMLFLPQEQNAGSVTRKKQKGIQSGGSYLCFLSPSSVTRLWPKQKFNWVAFLS